MIGIDTNVLARYYIEDKSDPEAGRQRTAARRLIESGKALMVCKTVVLEFEWILRGYYSFPKADVIAVLKHLMGLGHVTVEDREAVALAIAYAEAGLDFADGLHHASYRGCKSMASFDDKKFSRRAKKLGLAPSVSIPT